MDKNYKLFIFIIILCIINLISETDACTPSAPAETENSSAIIERTEYLKFLRDVNKGRNNMRQKFNRIWFRYLDCNGTYDQEIGDVLQGLCNYCAMIVNDYSTIEWDCMNKCYTGIGLSDCSGYYSREIGKTVEYLDGFVEKLSGKDILSYMTI
ncbi:uncharacterized protein LOC130678050 [Microplitis mediator]|uniref:uncharacterized protein LOC130678050 n=1 Tax=Microplitis mediator TaxID=375433 RepID=UPI0025525B10|nr:uncharacterized protein LOC130678050 [Microplitis mediator]